jgi:hypothetical protein
LQSNSSEGILTFNGNGAGTSTTTNVLVTMPQTPGFSASAGSSRTTGPFTYTIDNDGLVTLQFGLITGTVLTGSGAGQTFTTSDLPPLVGLIAKNGDELTLATVDASVETNTNQNGSTSQRVCHRSRVLIKLDKSK